MAEQQPSHGRRRTSPTASASAVLLGIALALAGCSGSHPAVGTTAPTPQGGSSRATVTAGPASTPQRTSTPIDARQGLLRASDLPGGFFDEPLTARNLPSDPSGCPAVRALWQRLAPATSSAEYAQIELTRGPLGPYVDEAVSVPADAPSTLAAATRAVAGCPALTVAEEGVAVRLTLRRTSAPRYGDGSASFAATGLWAGHPMALDIQLVRAGRTMLLLTETQVGTGLDPELVATVARTATAKASAAG